MSKKFKLQLPISDDLKVGLETIAREEGFDSVQAFARVVFTKVVKREISIPLISEPDEYISEEMEIRLNKETEEALEDLKKGEIKTYTDVDELIGDLHGL